MGISCMKKGSNRGWLKRQPEPVTVLGKVSCANQPVRYLMLPGAACLQGELRDTSGACKNQEQAGRERQGVNVGFDIAEYQEV